MVQAARKCAGRPHISHAAAKQPAGGRPGASAPRAAAAAPERICCAFLNCNRLWSSEGDLRNDFYGWADTLSNLGVRVAMLVEPWVPQCMSSARPTLRICVQCTAQHWQSGEGCRLNVLHGKPCHLHLSGAWRFSQQGYCRLPA